MMVQNPFNGIESYYKIQVKMYRKVWNPFNGIERAKRERARRTG